MINPAEHSPETLEQAVDIISQYLTDSEITFIENHGAIIAHHGFGTAIRNAWLWDNPQEGKVRPLAEHFRQRFGLGHADDMSGLILEGVNASVRDMAFDPEPVVKKYKAFWLAAGIDPLLQVKIET